MISGSGQGNGDDLGGFDTFEGAKGLFCLFGRALAVRDDNGELKAGKAESDGFDNNVLGTGKLLTDECFERREVDLGGLGHDLDDNCDVTHVSRPHESAFLAFVLDTLVTAAVAPVDGFPALRTFEGGPAGLGQGDVTGCAFFYRHVFYLLLATESNQ